MTQHARARVCFSIAVARLLRALWLPSFLVCLAAGDGAYAYMPEQAVVVQGILTDTISVISGDGQSGPTGGTAQPVVVEVRNPQGQPIAGRTILWSTNGHVLGATSSVTDAAGRASVGFDYAPTQGSFTITATDSTSGYSATASAFANGLSSINIVSGDHQSGAGGTHSVQPFVVEVRDAGGTPIVGRTINWTDHSGVVILDAASSVTDASGRASMGFTFTTSPGPNPVEALDPIRGASVFFNLSAAGGDVLSLVSGQNQNGPVGSHSSQDIVVEVRDGAGNPVVGRTIAWSDPNTNRFTLDAAISVTDAAGQARMGFTYLPASIGCGCTIQAQDAVSSLSANANASGIGGESFTLVSGQSQNGIIGSHSAQDIVVEVRDALGNPIAGRTINWTDHSGTPLYHNAAIHDT
jgi:hypothetical protein